ncbi:hypothetical protein BFW01_g4715 [Lasiodiplodia theobromae]|nr:hypothetical protein BFW01_g4715 [Lasiodiplodia theobromae]
MDAEMSEPGSGKGETSPRKASTTFSTRSSRRTASPSRASKQDDAGPPTPESPPFRLTRKRAASLADKGDREEADVVDEITPTTTHSRMSSGGASVGSAGSPATHVCLCQPDPKIPRPRNAFILYRQHHQAAIVAQHPGLANPEISKIIGEQWKAQPESVRSEWKALAEEEKIRHQQQYPEYRYQPRRGGRRGSLSLNTTSDKHHCTKCGGRSITTPTTAFPPSHNNAAATTASASSPSSNAPMLPPPTPSSLLTPTSRYLPPMMSGLAINTSAAAAVSNPQRRNNSTRTTPNPLTSLHASRTRDEHPMDAQMLSPLSPDAKRRRLQQAYVPPPSASSSGTPRSSSLAQPGTPYPFRPDPRRHSLPRPELMHHRGVSPRNGSTSIHHDGSSSNNLTLPPLQTANHHHPYPAAVHHAAVSPGTPAGVVSAGGGVGGVVTAGGGEQPPGSAKTVIMSLSFWGKIRLLGRITPPYQATLSPSPLSPRQQQKQQLPPRVRGAIVAVEGDNDAAARAMATWLEENLNKTGEVWARTAEAPRGPETVMGDGGEGERAGSDDGGDDGGAKSPDGNGAVAPRRTVSLGDYIQVISEWHSKTREMVEFITTPPGGAADAATDASTTASKDGEKGSGEVVDKRTPVLIMPTYNLRASNVWASSLPTGDNYNPPDHWQWVATLWRGIVGPDITVYIRDVSAAELEMSRGRTVEVREDGQSKYLIVKREGTQELEESTLRRLGFEIGELIRGVSGLNGK